MAGMLASILNLLSHEDEAPMRRIRQIGLDQIAQERRIGAGLEPFQKEYEMPGPMMSAQNDPQGNVQGFTSPYPGLRRPTLPMFKHSTTVAERDIPEATFGGQRGLGEMPKFPGTPYLPGTGMEAVPSPGAGTPYIPGTGMEVPPETNDPLSGEPQFKQGGVPMPRPRPTLPTDVSSANAAPAGAPLSIAPPEAAAAGPMAGIGGGMKSILGNLLKSENAPMLLALASGFSGAPSIGTGMRRAFGAAAPAVALMNKEQKGQLSQAETVRALQARGVPQAEALAAARNPVLLKALVDKYFGEGDLKEVNGRLIRVPRSGGAPTLIADYSEDKDAPKLSAGWRWKDPKDKSKGQEFIPDGPADPKVKALAARQSEPPKYEWVDPLDHSKGQRAIPGGGAEKVDANVAARLGLSQSFLDQLPDIRKGIKAGEATGLWDGAMGKLNIGRAGQLRRQIDSGAESLLRNLTGAGMNKEEAADYTRRYRLEATDTAATVESKLDQLERELNYTMEAVKKGRGGTIKITGGQIVPGAAADVPFKILQ